MTIRPPKPLYVPRLETQSAWRGHAPFAAWIMAHLLPRLTVELGTHTGFSFCCLADELLRQAYDGRIVAVDTWQGDEHAGFYGESVFAALSATVDRHYRTCAELKRMTFDAARADFADGSIDLLHIDGRHRYEDVRHDFSTWLPKLSPRSVVLMHDTQVRKGDFGVYKFWEQVRDAYPTFEFFHSFGLGVVATGPQTCSAVKDLVALDHDGTQAMAVRAAFAAAARALEATRHSERQGA